MCMRATRYTEGWDKVQQKALVQWNDSANADEVLWMVQVLFSHESLPWECLFLCIREYECVLVKVQQ